MRRTLATIGSALALVAIWGYVLCFALQGCVRLAHGAPVPARPKSLTPEMASGYWRFQWGAADQGVLALDPDGGYSCSLAPGSPMVYHGRWKLDGNTLVLTEWSYHVELGPQTGPTEYRVPLDLSAYPRMTGKYGEAVVVMHSPKR